jgi:hypothetical protein
VSIAPKGGVSFTVNAPHRVDHGPVSGPAPGTFRGHAKSDTSDDVIAVQLTVDAGGNCTMSLALQPPGASFDFRGGTYYVSNGDSIIDPRTNNQVGLLMTGPDGPVLKFTTATSDHQDSFTVMLERR